MRPYTGPYTGPAGTVRDIKDFPASNRNNYKSHLCWFCSLALGHCAPWPSQTVGKQISKLYFKRFHLPSLQMPISNT